MSAPAPAAQRPIVEFIRDPRQVRAAFLLFAVLFALTIAGVHALAMNAWDLGRIARERGAEMGVDELAAYREQAGRLSVPLVLLNAPMMVYLGVQARGEAPEPGPGYYVLLVLGSTYLPALFAFGLFFIREMLQERRRVLDQRDRERASPREPPGNHE